MHDLQARVKDIILLAARITSKAFLKDVFKLFVWEDFQSRIPGQAQSAWFKVIPVVQIIIAPPEAIALYAKIQVARECERESTSTKC